MKGLAGIPLIVLLVCSASAQSMPAERDVRSALKDAEYALRRFAEVSDRVDVSSWKTSKDIRDTNAETLHSLRKSAETAQQSLKDFDGGIRPTSSDLLDLMWLLSGVESELSDLGDNTLNFQDQPDVSETADASALAQELTRASGTAVAAEASIYKVLGQQLLAEESQLRECAGAAGNSRNTRKKGAPEASAH